MATKKVNVEPEIEQDFAPEETLETTKTIQIDLAEAEKLIDLYDSIDNADGHFKNCQSDIFRTYVSGALKAKNVKGAFDHLKELVNAAKS